jgi:cephalosporin-C deacetylase-like acetyl esterase
MAERIANFRLCCVMWAVLSVSLGVFTAGAAGTLSADDASAKAVADGLRALDARVFPADQREQLSAMVPDNIRQRLRAANAESSAAWHKIDNKQAWEQFCNPRIDALRKSLGNYPAAPKQVKTVVTGTLQGDGYEIDNIVFESRPGLWVTANLYRPAKPAASMPGILICHAHHTPKPHGELQDMGMSWARLGCLVLVMDQVGHGERRQHPFRSEADYPGSFRASRQDYYFRYDNAVELYLAGESLAGQIAWDLMRGVDVLLARDGIDPKRIMLLGSVAGGGDPCAVTAAIDPRITCAVPFNFGGPQPETRYPLPDDVESSFNYAGSGSWESTRNLNRSAGDGFLPWVIVGGIAPRRLIFSHEFSWDSERDPVWKRLNTIYGFYGVADNLSFTHGRGELKGTPPEATHCTHIGAFHRQLIHPAFARWFDIPGSTETEYSQRRASDELLCMTPAIQEKLQPRTLRDVLIESTAKQMAATRAELAGKTPEKRREALRSRWTPLLGQVETKAPAKVVSEATEKLPGNATLHRIALEVEPGIRVPAVLLVPQAKAGAKAPVVVAVAQSGKDALLKQRADEIAALLAGGTAVCLPDVRGTGETSFGGGRGRDSYATSLSASELMLGGTLVGARLRDLRSVLHYLRGRKDLDAQRIALWGDSLATPNSADTNCQVPHGIDRPAREVEPLGGLLALLGALYEEDIDAVYIRGGLSGYRSVLDSPFVYIPQDAVVPGALTVCDLCDIAASLAPAPLKLTGLVDGVNRTVSADAARAAYEPAIGAYRKADAAGRLSIGSEESAAAWLLECVKAN